MRVKVMLLFIVAVFLVFPVGCVEKSADIGERAVEPQQTSRLSPEEQEEEAYVIFNQILELSRGLERQANLPRMKELYRDIIEKYPDSWLAQESYMRLIIIARQKKTPEGDAEAERLYLEFLNKYPDSRLRRILEYEARGKTSS
jgi:hypothetical protein